MKLSSLPLVITLAFIAGFSALNWSTFIAPTELSFGFTHAQLPLGLLMLGLLAIVCVLFLGFVVYLETSALLATRRHSRDLHASRELADQAEASRFTELRGFLDAELVKLTKLHTESRTELLEKIGHLEQELRTSIEISGNSLAACIGEMDDRLNKSSAER